MEILKLSNIVKTYQIGGEKQTILNRINLQINKGEFVSILGPSGSGKSTLMNIIGCLDIATSGEYMIEGIKAADLDETQLAGLRNQKIGFVFQQFQLLPRLNALNNVELPLIYAESAAAMRSARAKQMLTRVGLADKMKYKPSQLSGGQQQRVAIARALVGEPSILLADEPTGALDQKNGQQIMDLFLALHREGKTIVMITHDEGIAQYADRIIRIQDGRIREEGHNA